MKIVGENVYFLDLSNVHADKKFKFRNFGITLPIIFPVNQLCSGKFYAPKLFLPVSMSLGEFRCFFCTDLNMLARLYYMMW